ncbi:MAG: hypothetical protein ACPHRA_13100, partial [Limisphaerales bacterium]
MKLTSIWTLLVWLSFGKLCMMPHLLAEDPSKPLGQSAPTLSQTTLQILQSQASTSAVEKPEDSPTIDKKKDSKK